MKFLNIDLEVTSAKRPSAFLRDLGDQVLILHDGKIAGRHFTAVELAASSKAEKKTLARLMSLLASLSEDGERDLRSAKVKKLDFGYSTRKGERFAHTIEASAVKALADYDFSIAVTVYEK